MMAINQEKEIERYLLSKNLNSELFIEIKDHFIEQISVQQEEKNISFQDAFQQAKMSWKKELNMVKADFLSSRKIARIEKSVIQKRFKTITFSAVAFSLLLAVFMYSNSNVFRYSQISLLSIMGVLLGYNLVFGKMRLYNYVRLSFHPLILKNAFVGIILFSVAWFWGNNVTDAGSGIMKIFFLYAIAVKIQLLYYNAKKTSVLI
ncbi:hypothetical protein [Chryseobacterium aurantiacum]|uniref:hypothetical protein n=1 Tax=Chryseobacterium aurantiacum TaxID=2116499 RepID=UPI000D12428B|nr:hypothetical protein [Chryseobacterium aurantiacum]